MAQSTSKSPGGIDIGVVQQVAVVVHDLQRFAVPDADFATEIRVRLRGPAAWHQD